MPSTFRLPDNSLANGVVIVNPSTGTGNSSSDISGRVGGICVRVSPSSGPTVTASSSYTSGNLVGSKLTIPAAARTGVGSGLVQSVVITSVSPQAASTFDVVFFNADPTNTTFTDKTAFSIASADLSKVIGVVHCTDTTTLGPTIHQAMNLALPFALVATTIYAAIVVRGSPIFTGTTDVALSLRVLQD